MKILCIIQCSNLGGMEKVTLDSLSLLQGTGHEVCLCSLHAVGDLKYLADKRGIPLNGCRGYKWAGMGNIREVLQLIKGFKPDRIWVVGHNFGSLFAGKLSGKPIYMSIHYHHSERSPYFWGLFYAFAKRVCRKIHFVSYYIYSEVSGLFGKLDQVVCFPNMLSDSGMTLMKSNARELLGLDDGAFVVGNAGWLIPRKAFDVFLRTAALIHREIPDAIFVIAGDGDERIKLENLAKSLGISQQVQFLGWEKDLQPFYAAVDLLLFNSHFDCLPTTPLEAMVRGIPVVCSLPNGGLKEVLRHGQDGFLIDTHDVAAMAKEVVRLYRDRNSMKGVAAQGCIRVREICSPKKHLENLTSFLELS